MKTLFQKFWSGVRLQSEEATLHQLDIYNKTRYSRRKNKDVLLELASREAHDKQNTYYATILNDDDSPYCAIASNAGFWGVDFLRDNFDDYLIYDYRDSISEDGRLFLYCIMLSECFPGTAQKRRRIDFYFTPEGSVMRVRHQDDEGNWATIREELPPLADEEVAKLWVPYPEFGEYDELIRLDRIPEIVRQRILEYTDQEYPAFREHLARDLAKYQWIE